MIHEDPSQNCGEHAPVHAQGDRIYRHSWNVPLLIGIPITGVVVILIIIGSLYGWLP